MEPAFELFDHTADMGLRVFAPTLAQLIDPAGQALYAVIGELAAGEEAREFEFDSRGSAAALLLRDYLTELLILFERESRIVVSPRVSAFDEGRLAVRGQVHRVDEARSVYNREVKAITYHELDIRRERGGYVATVIVDI
ncbi:MAG: archease [Planctomycetes bacterium]|nr:archease [Planctomycetota bacterium]